MNRIAYAITVLIIGISQYVNAATLEKNKGFSNQLLSQQESIKVPLKSSFEELMNPMIDIKFMDNLLTRRKGDIKYKELKVSWIKFIKNLEKKRQNPDQVMLDNRKYLT